MQILLIVLIALVMVNVALSIVSMARKKDDNTAQIVMQYTQTMAKTISDSQNSAMENMRKTIEDRLQSIERNNATRLAEMQNTVNEKLDKTLSSRLSESFKQVSDQLEKVYKGLGEMQQVAVGVTDLKKVLSNVKTRGILGEIQLGAILEQILSPEQYDTNVETIPGSKQRVEFAIKLPGDGENVVYMPIDSKFPGDTYQNLLDAEESGDLGTIESARKELIIRIKGCAKDIKEKYVASPFTTEFGIMFLPFEGLYAEVLKLGLMEVLQRDYHVNIAGPTTMAALLNSIQMGFKTLAIAERSTEVMRTLGNVKTEFGKFSDQLIKVQKKIREADSEVDTLITTRTNMMNRALKSIEETDDVGLLK